MPRSQPWKVIPVKQQKPGALLGGFWVVLQAYAVRNHWVLGMLGPEGARVTGGYAEWDTVQVPRERAITEWRGHRNMEMEIDFVIDGWIVAPQRPQLKTNLPIPPKLPVGVRHKRPQRVVNGRRVGKPRGVWIEGMVKDLESLAMRQPGDNTPHSLRVFGAVPHADKRWIITDLEWGDCIRDKITGRRMRQQVNVKLLEFYQPADLRRLPKAKPKPQPKRPKRPAKRPKRPART